MATQTRRTSEDPPPPLADVRGILLDVDGTLYDQRGLRRAMLWRLVRFAARAPLSGATVFRALRAYRHAQELIRSRPEMPEPVADLAAAQLDLAVSRTGLREPVVRDAVARWMETEPLPLLRRHVRPGLTGFLDAAAAHGVPVGVVSDYAAAAKLEAMGLTKHVRVVVCAQDADVRCFKPSARGLLVAAERLGVAPSSVLYVGDRVSVDGAAAASAGMRCAIVGTTHGSPAARELLVPDFIALQQLLFPG